VEIASLDLTSFQGSSIGFRAFLLSLFLSTGNFALSISIVNKRDIGASMKKYAGIEKTNVTT